MKDLNKNIGESIDTATGRKAPASLSSERVKEIFSHIAWKYERFNKLSSFGTYRLWLNNLVKLADASPKDSVLDVAGGTGDVSFAIEKAYHPKQIICSDLVPEMLEVAKSHRAKDPSIESNILFQVVDAQDMPFGDNEFDRVVMAYGLRNMPNRELALQEVYRVMKPGAKFACLDFSTPKNPLLRSLYHFYLKHMIPFWGNMVTGEKAGFVYLADSIKAFPDQEGVARMMAEAGFVDIGLHDQTGGIACIHTAQKPACIADGNICNDSRKNA